MPAEVRSCRREWRGRRWSRKVGDPVRPEDCCPVPDAAADLTLLADLRCTDPHRFFLTCVSGEAGAGRGADAWGPALLLEKDNHIVRTARPWQPPQLVRNGSQRITLHRFSKPADLVGVFSCVGGAGARRTRVLYVHNSPGGESGPQVGRDKRGRP